MLHDWRQRQLSRTRAIVFRRDDTLLTSKTLPVTTIQPKYRVYLSLLRLFTSTRSRLLFRGWRQQQLPRTRTVVFRRDYTLPTSKTYWRWPGNPNARSKFRNLCLFTFTRSQLTLWRRLCGRWRLPEIAQTARSRRKKHRQDDQDMIEIPRIRKCMPTWSSKRLKKIFVFCYERLRNWLRCLLVFSCYHAQRLLFSHSTNNLSTTLTPTDKPRYTYCRVFF